MGRDGRIGGGGRLGGRGVGQDAKCGDLGVGMATILPPKKIGELHPAASAPAFFIFSPTPAKSNPDIRNSKSARSRAGF